MALDDAVLAEFETRAAAAEQRLDAIEASLAKGATVLALVGSLCRPLEP